MPALAQKNPQDVRRCIAAKCTFGVSSTMTKRLKNLGSLLSQGWLSIRLKTRGIVERNERKVRR
jgi:hypothetical protein